VILHLRVDDFHQRSLMVLKYVSDIVLVWQIRLEMFDHLADLTDFLYQVDC